METDLFQSCGHCWAFQIFWHIEFSTFTAFSFKIWNSSAGISSPPLALFLVMLPKVHLTSPSRMFGSRWMNTPLCLSRSLRTFLYCSSVYSCHLFLISSASVSSILFLSLIVPIFAWNAFLICLSLLFSAICKTSSDNHFAFLNSFYWGWLWSLPPVKCSDKIWCTGGGNGKQFQHSCLENPVNVFSLLQYFKFLFDCHLWQ